ncbi:MAG: fibronectin type III domain-containing protein [Nitrospirota bacterium]|nr:fibronectin type III domain-containing protein [Nitrospirota bacterium]
MRTNWTNQSGWQRVLSIAATVAASAVMAFALTACGGDDETAAPPATSTVAAPGAPTALTATAGENVVTLQWSPPAASATAGLPDSYEIYRSTTATTPATLVAPAYFVTTTPVVPGQAVYSFTDIGLAGNTTYYFVVTAKNAGGETPSTVASARPTGPPNPVTYGNNFSAALIFADDIGITNLPLDPAKSWTVDKTLLDYNTGLRPLAAEVTAFPALQLTLPYLPLPSRIDPLYYEQKSINTWQGEWAKGAATPQNVTAKWGDNLLGASLRASAKIRIEMVLTKDVSATPMTAYTMRLLSGSGTNELQGTNGVPYNPTTAFVFATNAHLTLQKLDAAGVPTGALITDQALFDPAFPDGLNKLAGEIPVSGNFTYGFIWDPSTSGSTAGRYRITFRLDPNSQFGAGNPANNTFMTTATNGVRVSDTEAYIDIVVQ